jgi:hypothetical protein
MPGNAEIIIDHWWDRGHKPGQAQTNTKCTQHNSHVLWKWISTTKEWAKPTEYYNVTEVMAILHKTRDPKITSG